ncbi:MAG: serine/threonine-protein kinase [Phycisphaerales bacterium]
MIARPDLGVAETLEEAFGRMLDLSVDERASTLKDLQCDAPAFAATLEAMLQQDADLAAADASSSAASLKVTDPSASSSDRPTADPSASPSADPSASPSASPSANPSASPSDRRSADPWTNSSGRLSGRRTGGSKPTSSDAPDAGPRYQVGEVIGRGGMGVVHVARQVEAPGRSVAIKFLCGSPGPEAIARFHREGVALGRLDHPGVASALDAGTTADGRPFIVLELVDGAPIDDWCDRERLGMDARLRCFESVCEAIAHAHQRGIVHRDIKPSNVLMGEGGRVRVIDFGIAGLMEDGPRLTRADGWVGTPSNLPPEQIAGGERAVDTRSDVYALGLLLYELVAGAPPWNPDRLADAAPAELCRLLLDASPPRPSEQVSRLSPGAQARVAAARGITAAAHIRRIRGPLDRVIMRAIAKDPARRYPTVDALRADVARFRRHLPVEATSPSAAYVLRTFLRRHRGATLVAGIAAGLLVGATGFSTVSANRARDAERRAVESANGMVMAEAGARAREREAVAASDFLFSALEAATPTGTNADEVPVMGLLDRMSDELAAGMLDGSPEVATEVHRFLGETFDRLGDPERAAPHLLRVEDVRLAAGTEGGLRAQLRLASVLSEAGELEPAADRFIAVRMAADPGSELELLSTNGLANLRMRQGRFDQSLVLQREALELAEGFYGPDDHRMGYVLFNHGGLLAAMGRTADAEAWYRGALECFERGGSQASRTRCRAELGWRVLARLGRTDEARAELQLALDEARRDLGPGFPETRRTSTALMWRLIRDGRPLAAADHARGAMVDIVDHAPHAHRELASTSVWAAWTAMGVGRTDDAIDAIGVAERALAAHRAAEPDDDIAATAWRFHVIAADLATHVADPVVARSHLARAETLAKDASWARASHRSEHAWIRARLQVMAGERAQAAAILVAARRDLAAAEPRAWRLGRLDLELATIAAEIGDPIAARRRALGAAERLAAAFGDERAEVRTALEIAAAPNARPAG